MFEVKIMVCSSNSEGKVTWRKEKVFMESNFTNIVRDIRDEFGKYVPIVSIAKIGWDND
jgi:hypothetical protein